MNKNDRFSDDLIVLITDLLKSHCHAFYTEIHGFESLNFPLTEQSDLTDNLLLYIISVYKPLGIPGAEYFDFETSD